MLNRQLRLDPARILGLAEGDAIVIRNAGGRVAEEMRSLIMTQQLLGVREIVVIHHTDCGVTKFTNDVVHSRVHEALHQDISDMDFMTFSDIDASIKDDVSFLRKSPLVSTGTLINGYNYNVSTGQISLVVSITT
ncbi:uncharacterized protein L969DRAFT_84475 [Mixia osmundae IAM 14324]|uniref:uncharacterized protein n=1 Tax=Mixia osmundae (strain CBS 9802 / IAM 14324 / JCM 22182 / KY 12970) TaxID=764103 RepID=UPI0004A55943|nr:uncharacterized protein L969DRAFT_84475 [Mixia osmundae IAM 14324]KEI42599.1 hypothetical protein L969DRAFT_84475 [Mixia osmundae IAM 14324]